MAAGVGWAIENGASIISMSFSAIESEIFTQAINDAVTGGRNNLGCVILSITQNFGNNTITYPGSLENVIAVGATDNTDVRASFSNYGTGIDVVAPGVNIYATDRQGAIGYNTSSDTTGNYYANFSGTSAACPNTAGVVALILSVNPNLTQVQVRQILESNTDKISGYTYSSNVSGQPNGTWNNEVGYGRINAYKAVFSAAGGPITGSSVICSTSSTFSLTNFPSGCSVSWTASPSNMFTFYWLGYNYCHYHGFLRIKHNQRCLVRQSRVTIFYRNDTRGWSLQGYAVLLSVWTSTSLRLDY
jgi:cell wall-associated protease